jgi:ATP-dependent helicase/nuclease subunit A
LFREIIRACKKEKLAIAGADRLKIGAELAVKDLVALLSFLATPEDDLSLAVALRSPLFGWSEQELFDLAHKRPEKSYLWAEMRNRKSCFPETMRVLDALRQETDYLRPYELLERILTRFGGRKNLIARLGEEAEDGIDALLAQAIAYETMDIPGLTGFLTWLDAEEVEIKRQSDNESTLIRVMTVHGAKGLEAPIVILPDTAEKRNLIRDEVYNSDQNGVVWSVKADQNPKQATIDKAKIMERQKEERDRLLYVAMTRAEKWLIVCGAGNVGKSGKSWYSMIESGMKIAEACEHRDGLRLESGDWGKLPDTVLAKPAMPETTLPDWATRKATYPERAQKPLSPSGLGGAKSLPGEGRSEEEALERGVEIHLLLEHLPNHPAPDREKVARALLPDSAGFDDTFAETLTVITKPELEFLFRATSLAEVPVCATLPELQNTPVNGIIDRLIIGADTILAVDFKTNTVVPQTAADIPDGILRQLGAYAAALQQIYPDHEIKTAVLWTRTATFMPVEHACVTAALRHTTPT